MTKAIKNLIIHLSAGRDRSSFLDRFPPLLPFLDVVADIYLVSNNIAKDALRLKRIVNDVVSFLQEYSFYRITLHPVHPFSSRPSLEKLYQGFSRTTHPFNQEAYRHQSIARFMILPIVTIDGSVHHDDLNRCLMFLRARNFVPSLYLLGGVSAAAFAGLMHTEQERILLHTGEEGDQSSLVKTLCRHLGFDDVLAWVSGAAPSELPTCRSIVLGEADGMLHSCAADPAREISPASSARPAPDRLEELPCPSDESLLRYYLQTARLLQETLAVNSRSREWADVTVQLGSECLKRGWYLEGVQQFNAVLEGAPAREDKAAIFLSKAICHVKLGQIPQAQAALDETEKLNPSLAVIHYYRGLCEFALRDYLEAIDCLQKAIDMNAPGVPRGDAYFYMGMSHINILEYDEGLEVMEKAKAQYPPHQISPVLYYLGVCHFGKNDIETAQALFREALAAHPAEEDVSSIYLYLGMCYKEQEAYREALTMLEKARAAEEERLEVHNLMGYCYFKLKEHEKAVESFLRAVEIDPSSAMDWANLGVNVRALGDDGQALLLFKKAVSMDPSIGFAWKHLQELMEKQKE